MLLSILLSTFLCLADSPNTDFVHTDEKGNSYTEYNLQNGGYTDKEGHYHLSPDEINSGYFSYDKDGVLLP